MVAERNRRSFVLARLLLVHNLTRAEMKFAFENLADAKPLGIARCPGKTVETVQGTSRRSATPLKRGVNEKEVVLHKSAIIRGRRLAACSFPFALLFISVCAAKATTGV